MQWKSFLFRARGGKTSTAALFYSSLFCPRLEIWVDISRIRRELKPAPVPPSYLTLGSCNASTPHHLPTSSADSTGPGAGDGGRPQGSNSDQRVTPGLSAEMPLHFRILSASCLFQSSDLPQFKVAFMYRKKNSCFLFVFVFAPPYPYKLLLSLFLLVYPPGPLAWLCMQQK